MSHELNLAITLPADPLLLAAPVVLIIVLLLASKVLSKRRSKKAKVTGLAMASIELGIDLDPLGSDRGPVAQGKVNNHVVSIATLSGKGRKNKAETHYGVKYEAPEAPKFSLTKRIDASVPTLDTGNPKFDAVVAIHTEQPALLARFMTTNRRAAILRLLASWPTAEITNRESHFSTAGIEDDAEALVDAVCHLVASAETFDRPSPRPSDAPSAMTADDIAGIVEAHTPTASPDTTAVAATDSDMFEAPAPVIAPVAAPATEITEPALVAHAPAATAVSPTDEVTDEVTVDASSGMDELVAAAQAAYASGIATAAADTDVAEVTHDAPVAEAADPATDTATDLPAHAEHTINGDSDILTEVRLDEATVLNDLFNSGLDEAGTAARFEQVYRGREVSWAGEVLRLGPTDRGRQRIAAFVGSADGQDPDSGRVVALTAVNPEPVLAPGDVVTFTGTLVNLDTAQRLFHVV